MKRSFARKITLRFTLILVLFVIGNLVFYQLQERESIGVDRNGGVIDLSGRQRMLVTRSALLALSLFEADNAVARERWRDELSRTIDLLEQSHQKLLARGSGTSLPAQLPPPVHALYFESPVLLDEQITDYITAVKELTSSPAQEQMDPKKLAYVRQVVLTGDLLTGLDLVVQEHRKAHEAAIERIQQIQEWSLRTNVLMLLVMGFFVFIPMARQIRNDLRDMAKLNIVLEQRVESDREAQQQMSQHANELARSNAELEQFASVASHDLQEPLRKILAFGDRLEQRSASSLDKESLDYLRRMRLAAARMQDLINGLLTYSRVSTRAQPFQRIELSQVADEVLVDLEARIEQTTARVEVRDLPAIDADPMQMRQLLQNLIGNALKFHRPDRLPRIQVEGGLLTSQQAQERGYSPHEKLCQITVEDNGVGFDPRHADRLFNVFQRLHSRKEFEGTGVGLAICRKIAERHGGQIMAESQPGHGAKFIITLPLRQIGGEQAA